MTSPLAGVSTEDIAVGSYVATFTRNEPFFDKNDKNNFKWVLGFTVDAGQPHASHRQDEMFPISHATDQNFKWMLRRLAGAFGISQEQAVAATQGTQGNPRALLQALQRLVSPYMGRKFAIEIV
jgi:hypothetical protein